MEKERRELTEALNILQEQPYKLSTGTQQYDSEGGTRPSRVKKMTMTRVLRSVSSKKGARLQEHDTNIV